MEWAVHVCELRLWLQLVVETDMKIEERTLEPLLPNMSFKIRVGDSLIQQVGGLNFAHLKLSGLPPYLLGKITTLKAEKLKFFDNEKVRKFKTKEQGFREELNLFRSILDNQIQWIRNQMKQLEQPQEALFGESERAGGQKNVERSKELEEKLYRLITARIALKDRTAIPFVWDISFVEIFEGEKEGFDIVLGNPPYVRQELISDPHEKEESYTDDKWRERKKLYKEKLIKSIYQSYPKFFRYNEKTGKAARKMNAKNDLYVYFYIHGLSLLNNIGSFCFVTSNSWLDVGYGKDLQEFLIRNVPIRMIIDNQVKRTFKTADVNTIICLFGNPQMQIDQKQKSKFVMFKTPFENILNPIIFEEIDEAIDKKVTPEYRIITKSSEELLTAGSESHETPLTPKTYDIPRYVSYVGDKWGGKYLRASDIYYTILEKGKDKLVRLGDIAEVRRGFTTGANEFFYLTQEKIDEWGIEEEFLKPVIKSPRESNNSDLSKIKLHYKVLMCDKKKKELIESDVLKYIEFGEQKGYNKRPTCCSRNLWYNLGNWKPVDCFWMESINDMNRIYINPGYLLESDKFYGITFFENDSSWNYSVFLNSTIYSFFRELKGFHGMGQGVLKLPVYDVKNLDFIKVDFYEKLDVISRSQFSIFKECGLDREHQIRSQEPNPLPDRKALDDIVFDAIGLTEDERKEVYWSVCELVQRRLEKARSV